MRKLSKEELKIINTIEKNPGITEDSELLKEKEILYTLLQKGYIKKGEYGKTYEYFVNENSEYIKEKKKKRLEEYLNTSGKNLLIKFNGGKELDQKQKEMLNQFLESLKNEMDHE